MKNFTLLDIEQIKGEKKLDIIKKYGIRSSSTDFARLLGAFAHMDEYAGNSPFSRENGAGIYWLNSNSNDEACSLMVNQIYGPHPSSVRQYGGRPLCVDEQALSLVSKDNIKVVNGLVEIEYGEYPQTVVSKDYSSELDRAFSSGLMKPTGKTYTTDAVEMMDVKTPFQEKKYDEYEYLGEKYICFEPVQSLPTSHTRLSVYQDILKGAKYWVKVEPIKWLYDKQTNIFLSKHILFSGIQYSYIKEFMNNYFSVEIEPSIMENTKKY